MNNFKTEIKEELLNGKNFGNESADWMTLNRIKYTGEMMIQINDDIHIFSTILKYTNAVVKLLNTGSL